MTYHDSKVRASITAAALLLTCAAPHLAMAQSVNSQPDGPVACSAFQQSGNGSWSASPRHHLPAGSCVEPGSRANFRP
jgi:hypothetical protein